MKIYIGGDIVIKKRERGILNITDNRIISYLYSSVLNPKDFLWVINFKKKWLIERKKNEN